MKSLLYLLSCGLILIIVYSLFVGAFEFSDSQAYGLILLLIIVVVLIIWNSHSENKFKENFKLHNITVTFNLEAIVKAAGLSEEMTKKYFEVYKRLEKGEQIENSKIRIHGTEQEKTGKLDQRDIYETGMLTNGKGYNFTVIGILNSSRYLMVNSNSQNIGSAFTTDISCLGRIDIIEGMKYTHIYIIGTKIGYELGIINLDTENYYTHDCNWENTVFYDFMNDKPNKKILGIVPYSLVHYQPIGQRGHNRAYKILKKYDCVYTNETFVSIYSKHQYFWFYSSLINE